MKFLEHIWPWSRFASLERDLKKLKEDHSRTKAEVDRHLNTSRRMAMIMHLRGYDKAAVLFLFLSCFSGLGQPILRNYFTTNANPVVGGGAQVWTNDGTQIFPVTNSPYISVQIDRNASYWQAFEDENDSPVFATMGTDNEGYMVASDGGHSARIGIGHCNGTFASPTVSIQGDTLGHIEFYGFNAGGGFPSADPGAWIIVKQTGPSFDFGSPAEFHFKSTEIVPGPVDDLILSATNANFFPGTNGVLTVNGVISLTGTGQPQITFGETNSSPVNTTTPTKWISVKVQGESTAYRMPLYQ